MHCRPKNPVLQSGACLARHKCFSHFAKIKTFIDCLMFANDCEHLTKCEKSLFSGRETETSSGPLANAVFVPMLVYAKFSEVGEKLKNLLDFL